MAYPENLLTEPSLDFKKEEHSPPKHQELQHINSFAEGNKSAYCALDCKARCILGTKNKMLEISFLFFLFLSWLEKFVFSPYELYIHSWVLKQNNLIMWVRILALPPGTV